MKPDAGRSYRALQMNSEGTHCLGLLSHKHRVPEADFGGVYDSDDIRVVHVRRVLVLGHGQPRPEVPDGAGRGVPYFGQAVPPGLATAGVRAARRCMHVIAGGSAHAPGAVLGSVHSAGQAGSQGLADLGTSSHLQRGPAHGGSSWLGVVVRVVVTGTVTAAPATLGVGHAGGQTVVDLAGSAHSGDGVRDCVAKQVTGHRAVVVADTHQLRLAAKGGGVAKHALGLGVGVAGGSVFLGPALPAVAVQAVEVQPGGVAGQTLSCNFPPKWPNERPFLAGMRSYSLNT